MNGAACSALAAGCTSASFTSQIALTSSTKHTVPASLTHGSNFFCGALPYSGFLRIRLQKERKGIAGRSASTLQVRADAADGENEGGARQQNRTGPSTVWERNERLVKMQKELLEQLEERRKLHSALLESLDDPKSTIREFNESDSGGLPPVSRSLPPRNPSAVSSPLQTPPLSIRTTPISPPSPAAKAPASSSAPTSKSTPSSPVSSPPTAAKAAILGPASPGLSKASSPSPATVRTPPPSSTSSKAPLTATSPPKARAVPSTVRPPPQAIPSQPPPSAARKVAPTPPAVDLKAEVKKIEKVVKPNEEVLPPPSEEKPPPLAGANVMNVIMVASECAPWSKTGGLGDVVGALPKALARRGHRVMAIAPRYGNYEGVFDTGVRKRFDVSGQSMEVGYFHSYREGVDWVFIDHNEFHHREQNIYGGSREEVMRRMILLSKAAVEAPWHVPCGGVCYGDSNLVFIANDWHTALLPVYLQAYYRDNGLMTYARCILVIHNMAHQGRGPLAEFGRLGLPEHYVDKFRLYDPMGGEHMNVFMAGIICAHRVVAVSHGYAWEVQTQLGGWGLDGVMRTHSQKLRGVVNGIDTTEWSPEVDVFLKEDGYQNYSAQTLEDKAKCKAALQQELGLPVRADVPLLGFIGRLDHQKGVDIIGEAMPWITSQDVQLVMLGTGRHDLEDMLRGFEGSHREKVRAWVGFSVKIAHRITAGVDILLMPSRFEPCGLNQLYAMRYGTVPVVHAVGGLRDTVRAFDPFNNEGLGWTFDRADAGGLIHALGNAIYTYRDYKDSWKGLQLRGMTQDLSWDNAAQQYEDELLAAKYTW